MGASCWSYTVPWQGDPGAALDELQARVFRDGDYWWAVGNYCPGADDVDPTQRAAAPGPSSVDELWSHEFVQESGTHSILDVDRVLAPGKKPGFGGLEALTTAEARKLTGGGPLTRAHLPLPMDLVRERWTGRWAVLHDAEGNPAELHFWGYSGD
ncbi:hypothetical protein [Micromonospora coerulea]|uniref:hypothetical protein n=1 Tax=Micromonospora coerulea TaxID=47856 RepID=UPI001903BC8A|nr:hypothetical protein [Micromonospora veneta]